MNSDIKIIILRKKNAYKNIYIFLHAAQMFSHKKFHLFFLTANKNSCLKISIFSPPEGRGIVVSWFVC